MNQKCQFYKSKSLNSRLFGKLCKDMNTNFHHYKIRWISRGKVLSRVFDLRDKISSPGAAVSSQQSFESFFMVKLACLCGYFSLNYSANTCKEKRLQSFKVKIRYKQ